MQFVNDLSGKIGDFVIYEKTCDPIDKLHAIRIAYVGVKGDTPYSYKIRVQKRRVGECYQYSIEKQNPEKF